MRKKTLSAKLGSDVPESRTSLECEPFSGKSIGAYSNVSTINPTTKTRSSADTAYYSPVADRSNLTVILNSMVQKILLSDSEDGSEPTATGVEYMQNGITRSLAATREVILSAGVFISPNILELYGIGSGNPPQTLYRILK